MPTFSYPTYTDPKACPDCLAPLKDGWCSSCKKYVVGVRTGVHYFQAPDRPVKKTKKYPMFVVFFKNRTVKVIFITFFLLGMVLVAASMLPPGLMIAFEILVALAAVIVAMI